MPSTYETTTLTATLQYPDGSPAAGAKLTAKLTAADIESDSGFVVEQPTTATADSNGQIRVDLWPNTAGRAGTQYEITVRASDGRSLLSGVVTLPDVSTVDLSNVWETDPDDAVTLTQALVDEVHTYRNQAEGFRDQSREARDSAQSADTDAQQQAAKASAQAGVATNQAGVATYQAGQAKNSAQAAADSRNVATEQAGIATDAATRAGQSAEDADESTEEALNRYGIGSNLTAKSTSSFDIDAAIHESAQFMVTDDAGATPWQGQVLLLGVMASSVGDTIYATQFLETLDALSLAVRHYRGGEWEEFTVLVQNGMVPPELVPTYDADHIDRGVFAPERIPTIPASRAQADPAGTAQTVMQSHLDADDPHPQYANDTRLQAAISSAIDDLVNGAPGALDTLHELADALGDDADFAATVTSQLATKLNADQFTSDRVLDLLRQVDGGGSGLDADTLRGLLPSDFDPAGAANDAIGSHRSAANPHPQYTTTDDVTALISSALAGYTPAPGDGSSGDDTSDGSTGATDNDATLMVWSGL